MTVLSIPRRLALASGALFLSVPIIALEIMIVTQAPWWNPPYPEMVFWGISFFCICIFLVVGLVSVRRGSFLLTSLAFIIWIGLSGIVAFRMRYPALFFYSLFLLVLFSCLLAWIHYELGRTFFDPKLAWYQGFPKPIPGLQCQAVLGDKKLEFSVSRIDEAGVFIFVSAPPRTKPDLYSTFTSFLGKRNLQMIFNFRDRQVVCSGKPRVCLDRTIGLGVQFQSMTPDLSKDLGKFIELLHVEGYI